MKILHFLAYIVLSSFSIFAGIGQNSVDFTSDKSSGCGAIANIQFTDLSTGSILTWHWDFGNNNTSNLQNPIASYTNPGTYTVSLTVSGPKGSLTETKTAYIKVFSKPTAAFQLSSNKGCEPFEVAFSDASILADAPIARYIWDFGDGSPENNLKDPVYVYNTPGNYMVSLQVIDTNGCTDTKLYSSVEVEQRPTASFSTYNPPNNCSVPYSVSFANYSTGGSGLSYLWDFGDGNTSNLKEPIHSYTSMGKFDVQLIVMNSLCSDTFFLKNFVSLEPISASFSLSSKVYCYGDTIEFKSTATGANSYLWDFGDGTSSTSKNPFKIYTDSGKFTVQFTALAGSSCSASSTDSLEIVQVVSRFSSLEDTFCMLPTLVNFNNTSLNADEYRWWVNDSLVDTTNNLQDFDFNFQQFTEPWVKLHAYNTTLGCSNKDSMKLVIYNPSPSIIDLSDSTKGCFPVSVSFDFNYPFNHIDSLLNFEWFMDIDADSSTIRPVNYTFNDPGNHVITLKMENERACIAYAQKGVHVGDTLIPPDLVLPDTVCSGSDEFFMVNDSLFIYPQHLMYKLPSGLFVQRDLGYAPKKNFYFSQDTGKIYVRRFFDYNGCITQSKLDSFYVKGPIADFNMTSKCSNMLSFDFEARIKGDFSTFKWEFGDGSSNTTDLNPTFVYPNDSIFEVSFIAYNPDSSCIDTVKKLLQPEPPPQLSIIGGPHYCVGETASFHALTQNPSDTINWYMGGSLVIADTNKFKVQSMVSDTLTYKITAKNEFGCMDSTFLTVIFSEPKAKFDFFYNNACVPFPIQLISNSTAGHYPIDSIFWDTQPWGLDTNIANLVKTVDKGGVLGAQLIVQDQQGCRDTLRDDSLLLVKGNKLVMWSGDRSICVGDTVFLGNYSNINEPYYRWTFGDGDTATGFNSRHVYTQAGKFDISLKYLNDSLCDRVLKYDDYISVEAYPIADFTADTLTATCYPLAVTFQDLSNDPNIINWRWDFGDGVKSSFRNPFHNYLQPGKFDVTLIVDTKNGCADTLEKSQFIQTSGPTADFSISPDTGCIYEFFDFQITQFNNTKDFQWEFGDGIYGQNVMESHKYNSVGLKNTKLVLSDSTGTCTIVLEKSILVEESFADLEVSTLEACVDESINFENTSLNIVQLLWDFGDGTQSNISNSNHSYSLPGSYQVKLEVLGSNNCLDDTIVNITVNPRPTIGISSDTLICLGDSVQLEASGGAIYQWKPSISLSASNIPNPIAFPDTLTTYTVVVTNTFGCVDSATMSIAIHYPPKHTVFRDTNLIIGESILLSAEDNHGFISSWSPEMGLGCSTCQNTLAQPLQSTTYYLTTSDPFGCFSIIDSIHIKIKEAYSLKVPSAFTPNGDGNNDVIHVRGWGIKELLEFKIYNRWGEVVFESNDINKGWDGSYKNKAQNVETYVYTVKALMWNDEVFSDKGNLNLMR